MDGRFLDDEQFARAEALFQELVDLPPAERDAELRTRCPDDPELAAYVRRLFTAPAAERRGFLTPPAERGAADAPPLPADLPRRIGRFEIVRKLGEGGMGTVYEALQEVPRRPVALKIIRPLLAGTEMHQRFQREIELLGRLNHPGIAQIYEAGTEPSARGELHFFAMEYIGGTTLLDYMREHDLNVRQRLLLVATICEAVQFAHDKGVIHRDLKPGNIMVEEGTGLGNDAARIGRPKVLDFGVAHVLRQEDEAEESLLTREGQVVGTLAYMSPEQVAEEPLAVDGRADVYALGVILYEALTGQHPHDLTDLSLFEAGRVIRTTETASVSTLDPSLRGDVDTIVAKAMAKDREHRYASAADLASDIHRHLRGEPIAARPAGPLLRVRKTLRRRRDVVVGVAVTAVVVALLVGAGLLGKRPGAPNAEPIVMKRLAERWTENAEAYRCYLEGRNARYNRSCPEDILRVREWFEKALAIDPRYVPALAELARFQVETGPSSVGRYDPQRFAQALELARQAKDIDPESPEAWAAEAVALQRLDEPAALASLQKALELNPGNPDLHCLLGEFHHDAWRFPEAEAAFRRAIELDPEFLYPHSRLVWSLRGMGRYDDAMVVADEGLARDPVNPRLRWWKARVLADMDRPEEAIAEHEANIVDNPDYFWSYRQLGTLLNQSDRSAEADSVFLLIAHKWPQFPAGLAYAGWYFYSRRMYDQAEPLLRQAIAVEPYALLARLYLAWVQYRTERHEDAAATIAEMEAVWPDDIDGLYRVGIYYRFFARDYDKALARVEHGLTICPTDRALLLEKHWIHHMKSEFDLGAEAARRLVEARPGDYVGWYRLATHLYAGGKLDEARAAATASMTLREDYASGWVALGNVELMAGRRYQAAAAYEKSAALGGGGLGNLAIVYWMEGRFRRAIEVWKASLEAAPNNPDEHWMNIINCAWNFLNDAAETRRACDELLQTEYEYPTYANAKAWATLAEIEKSAGNTAKADSLRVLAAASFADYLAQRPDYVTAVVEAAEFHARWGDEAKARERLDWIEAQHGDDVFTRIDLMVILAQLGDNDAAFAQFDKAIEMGWDAPAIIKSHRGLARLREDPRFAEYMSRIR